MVVFEKLLLKFSQNFLLKALLKCSHKQALQSFLQNSQKCMLFLQGVIRILVKGSGLLTNTYTNTKPILPDKFKCHSNLRNVK